MQEIDTLFGAQWRNGMVPQLVFNPEALGHYFPEPDFWQTERSPDAPAGKLTPKAIREKLWHGEHEIFDAYDLVADELVEGDTAAGFLPLYAGAATREQAGTIYRRLNSASFCALHQGNCFTVPNYDTQREGFDRSKYWRGPVWININWMLAQGLRRYGYALKADSLQKDLLQLPIRFGFHEYFDSFDGTGYGTDGFGWTAALFIDLVNDFYERQRSEGGLIRRVKGVVASATVLNEGSELPDIPPENLAVALLRSIRQLRDLFYDTNRGRVDYGRLKESAEYRLYRSLSNGLRRFDPSKLLGRKEKLAFWVNLYNTVVVDGIAALGVQRSVKEVPEFFSKVKYAIGDRLFSPDDIEHGILRANARPWFRPFKPFGPRDPRRKWVVNPVDPRIHFALVCGSRSCAPIDYYDAAKIYDQLEQAAESFVNSSEVLVIPEQGKLLLSEIFRWYEDDFGGKTGVLDFLYDYLVDDAARRALREQSSTIQVEYIYYDRNLNR
jgi:hypothetical protein